MFKFNNQNLNHLFILINNQPQDIISLFYIFIYYYLYIE